MSQFSNLSPAAAALERENIWQREATWAATTGAAIQEANAQRFYAWSEDGFFKTVGKAVLEGSGLYDAGPRSGFSAISNFANDLFGQDLIDTAMRMGEDVLPDYMRRRDGGGRIMSQAGEVPGGITPRIISRAFYGAIGNSSFVPDDNLIGAYGTDNAGEMLDEETLLKLANATSEVEMAYIRAHAMSARDREQRFSKFGTVSRFSLELVGQLGDPIVFGSNAVAGGVGSAVGGFALRQGAGTLARLEAGGLIARAAGTTIRFGAKAGIAAGENVGQGAALAALADDDYTWHQAAIDMAMGAGFASVGSAGKAALSKVVRGNQATMAAESDFKITEKGKGFFVEVPGHRENATVADLRRADFGAATRSAEREGVPVGPDLQPIFTSEAAVLGRTVRTADGVRAEIVSRNGDTVQVRKTDGSIEVHDVGQLMYDRSRVPGVGDKVRFDDGTLGTVRSVDGTGLAAVSRDVSPVGKRRGANSPIEYVPVSLLDEHAGPATVRKGATVIDNDGRAVIGFLKSRDPSTVVHETGHVFRRTLRAIDSDAADELNRLLGEVDDRWSVQSEEKFARLFERYVSEGKAPTKSLAKTFAAFRGWLTDLWARLKGEAPEQITPELTAIMDKLVDGNAVGPRAKPGENYVRVRDQIINALGKNGQHSELSSAMLSLVNANAGAWSRAKGVNFDDYFKDVLVGVEKGNVTKERFMRRMLPKLHREALVTPDRRWKEIERVLAGEVHESTLTRAQWRMIRESGAETPAMRAWREDKYRRAWERADVSEARKIDQMPGLVAEIDRQIKIDAKLDRLIAEQATDPEKNSYWNAAARLQAEDPNVSGDGISKEQWDNIYAELTLTRLRLGEPDANGVRSTPNGIVHVVPDLNGAARIVNGRLQISPAVAAMKAMARRSLIANSVMAREVLMILGAEAQNARPVPRQSVAHIAAWMDRNGLMPADQAKGVARMVLHTIAESQSDHISLRSLMGGGPEPLSPDDPGFVGSQWDPFADQRTENVDIPPEFQRTINVVTDPTAYVRSHEDGPVLFIEKLLGDLSSGLDVVSDTFGENAADGSGTPLRDQWKGGFLGKIPDDAQWVFASHPSSRRYVHGNLSDKFDTHGMKARGGAEDFIADHGLDAWIRVLIEISESDRSKTLRIMGDSHDTPTGFANMMREQWMEMSRRQREVNKPVTDARSLIRKVNGGKVAIVSDEMYDAMVREARDVSAIRTEKDKQAHKRKIKQLDGVVRESTYTAAVEKAKEKTVGGLGASSVHYIPVQEVPEGTTFTAAGVRMEVGKFNQLKFIDPTLHEPTERVVEWPGQLMPIDRDSLTLPDRSVLIERENQKNAEADMAASAEYAAFLERQAAERDAIAAEVEDFYRQERESLAAGQDPLYRTDTDPAFGGVSEFEQTSRPLTDQPLGQPGDVRVFDPKSISGSKIAGLVGKMAFGRRAHLLDSPSKFIQDAAAMLFNSPLVGENGKGAIETADLFVERRVGEINGLYIGKVRATFAKYAAENRIPLRQRSAAFNDFMRKAGDLAAQTDATIPDPHLKSVVEATRDAIAQAHAVARANGVNLPDYDPAYFTRLWSAGRKAALIKKLHDAGVGDGMREVHALLQEAILDQAPDLTPDEALKLAMVYAERIDNVSRESALSRAVTLGKLESYDRTVKMLGDSGRFTDAEAKALASKLTGNPVTGRPANPTKGRSWRMNDRYTKTIQTPKGPVQISVADLLETRADHIVHAYAHSMVAEGAIHTTLKTLSDRYGFPISSVESLLQTAEREMRAAGMSDSVIRRQMLRLSTGINLVRGLPNHQGEFAEWARRLRMFNYIRKQAGFVVSAAFELGGVPSRASVGAMMRTMPLAREIYGQMKQGKIDSGLARAVLASMGAGHEGQLRDYLPDIEDRNAPFITGGDRARNMIDDGLRRGVGMVSKGTGFQQINDYSHIWARLTYMQHLADLARRDQSPSAHRLAQIGLTEPQWKEIAAELKNASSKSAGTGGLISDIDLDAFKSADARTRFLYAVDNKARTLIQQNGIGQSDYWMETPGARLVLQFRNFMLNAWERQLLANIQQVDGESAAFFASSMGMGFLQYAAMSYLDTRGMDDPDSEFKKRMEPQRAAVAAFSRAAFSGIAPTLIDSVLVSSGYKPLGGYRATGLDSDPIFGNPTVQLIGEGRSSLFRLARAGLDPNYDVSQADLSGARSLLPFHRFPGIMAVTNRMMDGLPKRPQKAQTDPLDWWNN